MQMNRNVKTVLSEELLGDDSDVIVENNEFIFDNLEVLRREDKSYIGEIVDIGVGKGKYKDGKEYKQAEVVFKIVDEDGESEAIYTFDLGLAIILNKRMKVLLLNTIGKIPTGKNINIKQLLLGKRACIKVKNYTNYDLITTAYVVEISKAN